VPSKPSISTSSWLSVCSRSSLPPEMLFILLLPIASNSSIKIIHGALVLACLNKSLTRAAPTPTNISTKSAPLMRKKATPASPATARASRVFPVPGGPTRSTPFGILPPISLYFCGLFKKSTTSTSSSLASSTPATSLKRVTMSPSATITARFCPTERTLPPILPIRLKTKRQIITKKAIGKTQLTIKPSIAFPSRGTAPYATFFSSINLIKS